jgi:hypothetical protein
MSVDLGNTVFQDNVSDSTRNNHTVLQATTGGKSFLDSFLEICPYTVPCFVLADGKEFAYVKKPSYTVKFESWRR